jgi:hypothetical protein
MASNHISSAILIMHFLVLQGEAGPVVIRDGSVRISVPPEELFGRQWDGEWPATYESWWAVPAAASLLCQQPAPCSGT